MRAEDAGATSISQSLLSMSAVTNIVGDRVFNLPFIPQGIERPVCYHWFEPGGPGYRRTIQGRGKPAETGLRWVVLFSCPGYSSDPIADAADAVLDAFCGDLKQVPGFRVTAEQLEPWPQVLGSGALLDTDQPYRAIGDFYQINIYRIPGGS